MIRKFFFLVLMAAFVAMSSHAADFPAPVNGTSYQSGVDTLTAAGMTAIDETAELADGLTDGVYLASKYLLDNPASVSGGLVEAITACETAGGGVVRFAGSIALDSANFTTRMLYFSDATGTCVLEGVAQNPRLEDGDTCASTLVVDANSSTINVIEVGPSATGAGFRNFCIDINEAAAGTIGIMANVGTGQRIENVSMDSDGANGTGAGIGIYIDDWLKSEIQGGELNDFATGIVVDGFCNASAIRDISIREGGLGIEFRDTDNNQEASDFIVDGITVEGLERGVWFSTGTRQHVTFISNHFEMSTGTLASRYGINIESAHASIYGIGGRFGGSMNDGTDIMRDTASGSRGPDVWTGGTFTQGITYTGDAEGDEMILLVAPRFLKMATGRVFQDISLYSSGNTCAADMVTNGSMALGALCLEADGDRFYCADPDNVAGTFDGICDNAVEISQISTGGGGASDATTTATGSLEIATTAEIEAGTATGGDGPLAVTPDALAASDLVVASLSTGAGTDGTRVVGFGNNTSLDEPATAGDCVIGPVAGVMSRRCNGGSTVSLEGGSGDVLSIEQGTDTLTFASIASANCLTDTTAITGGLTSDIVGFTINEDLDPDVASGVLGLSPVTTGGISLNARVTSATVLTWQACNWTESALDPDDFAVNYRIAR